jgi:hypothetical protein
LGSEEGLDLDGLDSGEEGLDSEEDLDSEERLDSDGLDSGEEGLDSDGGGCWSGSDD